MNKYDLQATRLSATGKRCGGVIFQQQGEKDQRDNGVAYRKR